MALEQQHAECTYDIGKFSSCVLLMSGILSAHSLLLGPHGVDNIIEQLRIALKQLNSEVENFIGLVKQEN